MKEGLWITSVILAFVGGGAAGWFVCKLVGTLPRKLMKLRQKADQAIGQIEGEARTRALALKDRADRERVALVKKAAEAAGVNIQVL